MIYCSVSLQIFNSSFDSPHGQLNFSSQRENQDSRIPGGTSVTAGNSVSSGVSSSSKTRIRWTPDLHEKFVECVHRLGGADSKCCHEFLLSVSDPLLVALRVDCHFYFLNFRGYTQGSIEVDGLGGIDNLSCQESFAGID